MSQRFPLSITDESNTVNVIPLGEPVASIVDIRVRDMVTGVVYNVYPEGVQAYCTPMGAVNTLGLGGTVSNVGTVDGVLFLRITEADTGTVIYQVSFTLAAGRSLSWGYTTCKMPAHPYSLIIEVGH